MQTQAHETPQVKSSALSGWQRALLQKVATGAPLIEFLELLIGVLESEVSVATGLVMIASPDGRSVSFGAGARIPRVLRDAWREMPVTEAHGSCGAAAVRREPVVYPDVERAPMLPEISQALLAHGYRCAWSHPLLSSKGELLGTLCMLLSESKAPDARMRDLIESAAHLAGLAIERDRLDRLRRLHANTFGLLSEALIIADVDGRIVDCNAAAERMWGFRRDELIGQTPAILYPPEQTDQAATEVLQLVRQQGSWTGEREFQRKNGQRGVREVTVILLSDEDKKELGFIGVNRDITERKRAEQELRNAHQRLNYHVENSPLAFIEWGADMRVLRWSKQAEAIFGWRAEEVLGKHPLEWRFVFDEDVPGVEEAMRRLTSGKYPRVNHANRNFTRDGRVLHCMWHTSTLTDDQGRMLCSMSLVNDLTEQVQAQEERERLGMQMLQTQKLESLGILAGGIAHDFNNLLTGMLGHAELLAERMRADNPLLGSVRAIAHSATRAAELTRQMLAYSGKATFEIAPLDLSAEVREIGELLSSSVSKKVELAFDLAGNLPAIEADRAQIQQLTMNLVINAAEALGERVGRVEITTSRAQHPKGAKHLRFPPGGLPPGDYVALEVRDNGCGMGEATISRIFDPFFTTKFTGRGLGLAAVLGIVRGHRGGLKVESQPNVGTTFRVLFPVSERAVERPRAPVLVALERRGRVLVIDDEPVVIELASAALEHFGFEVVTASSGEEGLATFQVEQERIDLVLLDMTLPRMGGDEILAELRKLRPDVRVILTSGYSELEASRHVPLEGLAGFIQKPYSPRTLAEKVRAAIS